MPKIYQSYCMVGDKFRVHHTASLTNAEAEARFVAAEQGKTVAVDVLDVEKLSLKWLIVALNGGNSPLVSRTTLSVFRPRTSFLAEQDGEVVTRWRVKKEAFSGGVPKDNLRFWPKKILGAHAQEGIVEC